MQRSSLINLLFPLSKDADSVEQVTYLKSVGTQYATDHSKNFIQNSPLTSYKVVVTEQDQSSPNAQQMSSLTARYPALEKDQIEHALKVWDSASVPKSVPNLKGILSAQEFVAAKIYQNDQDYYDELIQKDEANWQNFYQDATAGITILTRHHYDPKVILDMW